MYHSYLKVLQLSLHKSFSIDFEKQYEARPQPKCFVIPPTATAFVGKTGLALNLVSPL